MLIMMSGAGASEATVRLISAEIDGPAVTLAQCATIEGDAGIVERLGAIEVERIDAGSRRLPARLVRAAIAQALPGFAVTITGESVLTRRMRVVGEAELLAALHARYASDQPEQLALVRWSGSAAIPANAIPELIVEAIDPTAGAGEIAHRVLVRTEQREWGRFLVVAEVRRFHQVAVATRDLPRGTVVQSSDLVLDRRSALIRRPAVDLAALVGRMTLGAIAEGTEVLPTALAEVPLVTGGQEVTLLIDSGRFQLSTRGVALSDGRLGAIVSVRRATDGRTVRAIVIGAGELRLPQ